MPAVYFDSSVFLAVFMGEPEATAIGDLIRELKRDKTRIVTSIITVQEVSVRPFLKGVASPEHYERVNKIARIFSIDRETALRAAQLEAALIKKGKGKEKPGEKQRRKWDCFHIATALAQRCSTFYALDRTLLKRPTHIAIPALRFSKPEPQAPRLAFDEEQTQPTATP